jgi:hypothetical protein
MNSIKATELGAALARKGFVKEKGGDHDWYYLYYAGKQTSVRTKLSRGSSYEYAGTLLRKVFSQLKMDKQQFTDFVKCPLTPEMYIDILISANILEAELSPAKKIQEE